MGETAMGIEGRIHAQDRHDPFADPRLAQAIATGRKVEAVKLLRKATGLSLTEAKQAVDEQFGPAAPIPGSFAQRKARAVRHGDIPAAGPHILRSGLWLMLLLLAIAGFWLMSAG